MRIILIILGLVALALIYWFGNPARRKQSRRRERGSEHRVEPTLGDGGADTAPAADPAAADNAEPVQSELTMGEPEAQEPEAQSPAAADPVSADVSAARVEAAASLPGRRADAPDAERIVSVLVVPRLDNQRFHGPDIVVAAEKAGLAYGDMGIFHRLTDGNPEDAPIFSAANMVKPGSFDMAGIRELETPGLNLFMVMPGPEPALDAWDAMLPTARRLAELLDGRVVDDQHNALGRQRVAYIRDELRAWDRKRAIKAGNKS